MQLWVMNIFDQIWYKNLLYANAKYRILMSTNSWVSYREITQGNWSSVRINSSRMISILAQSVQQSHSMVQSTVNTEIPILQISDLISPAKRLPCNESCMILLRFFNDTGTNPVKSLSFKDDVCIFHSLFETTLIMTLDINIYKMSFYTAN